MDKNRNELLRRLAQASSSGSLQEQRDLVQALAQLDREAALRAQEEKSLDWADTAVKSRMQTVATHSMVSTETDWMEDLQTTASSDDYHNKIHAEASMWFNRVDADVKADADEFAEQARGVARRVTGHLGEQAETAAQDFLNYVAFLYKQAASGLPQVQQEYDPQDQFAPTPLPPEVFPTFEGPVHPINEWVENGSTTDSNRPSRAQQVGTDGNKSLPNETDPSSRANYSTPGDAGTGQTSQHSTDDAHDRSANENWPETTPSGDSASGGRPSEHSTEDDHTSKVSAITSTSLWDFLAGEEDLEREAGFGDAAKKVWDNVKKGPDGDLVERKKRDEESARNQPAAPTNPPGGSSSDSESKGSPILSPVDVVKRVKDKITGASRVSRVVDSPAGNTAPNPEHVSTSPLGSDLRKQDEQYRKDNPEKPDPKGSNVHPSQDKPGPGAA